MRLILKWGLFVWLWVCCFSCKQAADQGGTLNSTLPLDTEAASQIDCNAISNSFSSYEEAMETIKAARFKFADELGNSGSSWIVNAFFYSCDGQTGYFILSTEKKDYLYKDMPLTIWYEFKNALSHGSYYNQMIRGRYAFTLAPEMK